MLKDERAAIADALLAQQVMTHRANRPLAIGGSVFAAVVFVTMEWGSVPATPLFGWFTLLAVVLVLREAAARFDRPGASEPAVNRARMRRFRLGFLAHGLVWGLANALPMPQGDALHQAILIIVLAGITAGSFALTAFDLTAALLFGVPVLGLLSLRLFAQTDPTYWTLGIAVIGELAFLSLTARRAHRVVRNYVALRLAEAAQAEALRRSEELLARTGATAGVGGLEIDTATMSLRLTAEVYRIHDVPPGAAPDFETFIGPYGPEQRISIRAAVEAAMAHGTPFDLELPLVTARGHHKWVRLTGAAQPEVGKAQRVSGVVQDITLARTTELALAEKHRLMNLLLQTTSDGFWFVDADAVTTDVNPAMCEILGRTRDDIVGKSIFAFVDAANAAIFSGQIQRRAEGIAGGYEIALTRPDGTQVDCFINATPIFDTAGRRTGSVGMLTDISERKRAEQLHCDTREQLILKTLALQVTLDSISQGLVSIDAEGRFLVYNRRALELLDLPESLLGPQTTYDDVVRFQVQRGDLADDAGFVDADGQRRYFKGGRINSPEVYVRKTRAGVLIEVRTRQLPGGGMVRTFADVTAYIEAQRALRESEAEMRALLDAFPGFIAVGDSRFTYTYVNERFAALNGRSRDDIIGRPVREDLGAARFATFEEYVVRVRAGEQVTVESEYEPSADRPRTWLQVTHSMGGGGGVAGRQKFYAFGIDISARKCAEQALIAARDEAERANRAKSQFLSSMSHELRTPMNAILGFGQLLMSDPKNPLADHQRDYAREILRGGRHLLSLINEVLDLALVETGKLQISLEPVRVSALLHECLALMDPLARRDAISLELVDEAACECLVAADRTRLKQVLLNLLSNAIKYNRARGHVRVACTADGDALRIAISDSGNGLSPEQGERLFQAFERLGAGQTQVEGAGLGLALSKRLMQAMGGDIGLESEIGQGSTFWVRLPRAAAQDDDADTVLSAPMPLAAAPGAARLRKVLYIEDNPINVLLMEAILARMPDLQMITAPLPELGLQMATDERPDLILLDIQLPGMDGFEVLRRLRLDEATRALPVIAVSANAMAGDIAQGLAAGFDWYLTKPLDMVQLIAAVERALAAR